MSHLNNWVFEKTNRYGDKIKNEYIVKKLPREGHIEDFIMQELATSRVIRLVANFEGARAIVKPILLLAAESSPNQIQLTSKLAGLTKGGKQDEIEIVWIRESLRALS